MKLPRRRLVKPVVAPGIRAEDLFLCAFYLFGILAGHLLGGLVPRQDQQELASYLTGYAAGTAGALPVMSVLLAYFRGVVLFALLGFVPWGVWLVPAALTVQGACFSFTVHAFVSALGRGGVWLALAAFGLRCVFILPCCFYFARRSWLAAAQLRSGRSRTAGPALPVYPLILCTVILLIGCVAECSVVPRLLHLVAERCF